MIYGLLGPSQVVHDFVQRYQQDSPYRFPPTLQQAPCWPFPDSRIPCIVQQLDFGQGHLWEIVPLRKFFKVHNMEGQDWGSFPTFPQIFPPERQRGWESVDLVVFFFGFFGCFQMFTLHFYICTCRSWNDDLKPSLWNWKRKKHTLADVASHHLAPEILLAPTKKGKKSWLVDWHLLPWLQWLAAWPLCPALCHVEAAHLPGMHLPHPTCRLRVAGVRCRL